MRCCLIAIEHARNDKGLTREDLAERIRKSERYVVAIERGERTPSLKTCYQIVRCLGISADKLFYPEATLDENSATREITRMLTSDTLLSTPFATRALERGMDYKTLSVILGHYSVAFTMDTYVHSMDEHKRHEMDKMDDMFGMQYSISVENQPYPVLCTLSADGYTAHVPDFPKITTQTATLDAALLEVKQQIQKALHQYKYPPIPTRQEQIVVPDNSVLVLVKVG